MALSSMSEQQFYQMSPEQQQAYLNSQQQQVAPNQGQSILNTIVGQGVNRGVHGLVNSLMGGGSGATASGIGAGQAGLSGSIGGLAPGASIAEAGPMSSSLVGGASQGAAAAPSAMGGLGPMAGVAALAALGANRGFKAYESSKHRGLGDAFAHQLSDPGGIAGLTLAAPITIPAIIAGSLFGGKKHKDQYARDSVRQQMLQSGIIGDDYNLDLGNGTSFNVGQDGQHMLTNAGGEQRHPYDVDWNDPRSASAVGAADPLAYYFSQQAGQTDPNRQANFAGYLSNTILSGGDPEQNARALYQKAAAAGIDRNKIYEFVANQSREGKLDPNTRDAYFAAIDKAFGVKNPTNARYDQQAGLPPATQGGISASPAILTPAQQKSGVLKNLASSQPQGGNIPTKTTAPKDTNSSPRGANMPRPQSSQPRNMQGYGTGIFGLSRRGKKK